MVKLFCVLVGMDGGAFSVTIDPSENVHDLKKAIKKKIKNDLKRVDANELQLFLARNGDAWLESSTDDMKKLKKGEKTALVEALTHEDNELDGDFSVEKVLEVMSEPKAEQIHLLVVVPGGATREDDALSLLRDARRTLMEMKELTATLRHKLPTSDYSDEALGQLELQRLKKDELIIEVEAMGDGEAFWSEEIQIHADGITSEAAFDVFITPFLDDILHHCGVVFVNSKRRPWLPQSSNLTKVKDLEPGGFATHRGMYHRRAAPDDGVLRPDEFRFGVADEELFDCLILFESKLTITDAAFGQVARYLQHLLPVGPAVAVLFDRRRFWLIKSYKTVIVKVQMAKWANNGSKALLQNFITDNESSWVSHLNLACLCFGVDVVEGDAFLGRGAFGRVFKVVQRDGMVCALKIVENCSVGLLYQEKVALARAQHTGLTARAVGEVLETPESAFLFLSPVGKPVPHPRTMQEIQSLFGLLWELHENDLVHGDPRGKCDS